MRPYHRRLGCVVVSWSTGRSVWQADGGEKKGTKPLARKTNPSYGIMAASGENCGSVTDVRSGGTMENLVGPDVVLNR